MCEIPKGSQDLSSFFGVLFLGSRAEVGKALVLGDFLGLKKQESDLPGCEHFHFTSAHGEVKGKAWQDHTAHTPAE